MFDGGNHGGYEDTFYRYLNLGIRVPFSTGTDWFIYDFSRVYADLNGAKMTAQNWLKALRAGRTFISNGPLLDLRVGDAGIGDTIRLDLPRKIRFRASALGRGDFAKIELIHNGKAAATATSARKTGHFAATIDVSLNIKESGWVALRAAPKVLPTAPQTPIRGSGDGKNEMGEGLFAHTSPVYIQVGGRDRFDPAVAAELIKEMEQGLLTIQMSGVFANDREREQVAQVYEDAISSLRDRVATAAAQAK